MIFGFNFTRFRYGPLSTNYECSAVIDDEHKTLMISNLDEANIFIAQEIPLETISSISFGHEPCTMVLGIDTPASKSTSGRGPQIFVETQPASDREFIYKVLKKSNGEGKLRLKGTHDMAFRRWEHNISDSSKEGLHGQSAVKQSRIRPLQEELADAQITQPRATTEPKGGYQLDDMLTLQISQVLMVLDGYDRIEQQLKDMREELTRVRDELAGAQDRIARKESQIAAFGGRPACIQDGRRPAQVPCVLLGWSLL